MNIDWLFVQFSCGGGGRILLSCISTSDSIGNWLPNTLPDPVEYVKAKFCATPYQHMKTEIKMPYDFSWFTRQLPFTRGDDLNSEQCYQLAMQDPVAKDHIEQNKKIICYWHKPYIPQWFTGNVITIYDDEETHEWLMERRTKLFYRWDEKNKIAYNLRFRPEGISNVKLLSKFSDNPQTEFSYIEKRDLVEKDYESEKISKGPGLNISLKTLLSEDPDSIWNRIDTLLEKPIDRNWANSAINTWRKHWVNL